MGATRALEQDDLYDLQINDRTASSARRLVRNWAHERRQQPKRASFWHAGHATFGRYFWVTGLLELVRVLALFAVPQLNRNLLEYLASDGLTMSFTSAIATAVLVFLCATVQTLCNGQFNFRLQRLSLHIQVQIQIQMYSSLE